MMPRSCLFSLALFLLPLFFIGCAATLIDISYEAADQLIVKLDNNYNNIKKPLRRDRPIIITTFMDMAHLDTTSRMGRVMAEQFSSRFSEQGFSMIELKLLNKIYIVKGVGEYVLSREVSLAAKEYDAQAVIVGTYSLIKDQLYVNVKIVDTDGNVYSSHDFSVNKSRYM